MNDTGEVESEVVSARVMIVDDHPLVRRGLAQLIDSQEALTICGEAGDAAEATPRLDELKPDLMIVDISLGGVNGIELIKRIRAKSNEVKILVSSMHDESIYAERALRAGASGYVNKEVATETVIEAIRTVLTGEHYFSSDLTGSLMKRVVDGTAGDGSPVDALSDREIEVFEKIGKGMMTREIAELLKLSVKTIETHREHIKIKLRLRNAAELTRSAVQWVIENE